MGRDSGEGQGEGQRRGAGRGAGERDRGKGQGVGDIGEVQEKGTEQRDREGGTAERDVGEDQGERTRERGPGREDQGGGTVKGNKRVWIAAVMHIHCGCSSSTCMLRLSRSSVHIAPVK